jgi:hypothetical protein
MQWRVAARFKPSFFTDPIFQGLAISLVFGLASSTALTLLVIPAIYVVPRDDEATPNIQNKEMKRWFRIGRN